MSRIKIEDLSDNVEISEEEMKKMTGGGLIDDPLNIGGLPPLPGLPPSGFGSNEFDDQWQQKYYIPWRK